MAVISLGTTCPRCFSPLDKGLLCMHCGFNVAAMKVHAQALNCFSILAQRYLIGCTLGAGGFGITYAAYDTEEGRRVAIKEYFRSDLCERAADGTTVAVQSKPEAYRHGLEGFFKEARILEQLQLCPYVVDVYGCFRANNTAYIVMQFVEGYNLRQLAQEHGGKVPLSIAEPILISAALGLSMTHSCGLTHRDIAPDNIIYRPSDSSVVLIDFGATRHTALTDASGISVLLKPGYAPPEQYSRNGKQGPWTDVYSLACTFYRITTNVPVPDSMDRLSGARTLQPLSELLPEVSPQVSAAIEKALSLRWEERQQNMDAFIGDFTYTQGSDITTDDGDQPRHKESRFLQRLRALFLGAPDSNPEPARERQPGNASVPSKPVRASVRVLSGINAGSVYPLPVGQEFVIGRQPTPCGIVIGMDAYISRRHCSLSVVPGAPRPTIRIKDTSTHGTYVETSGVWLQQGVLDVTDSVVLRIVKEGYRLLINVES